MIKINTVKMLKNNYKNMEKIIIGISGQISAGKDTVANYIMQKYNAKQLKFSKVLRDILQRIYKDINRENMSKLSTALRQVFGEDMLVNIIYNDINNSQEEIIVLDGVRRMPDIEMLQPIPGFKLFYIDAGIDTRYERLIQRSENSDDRAKSFEEFKKDHELETELQILGLKDHADYIIDNSGSLNDLYKQVDTIIFNLKNS